jgi:hypothetical protein
MNFWEWLQYNAWKVKAALGDTDAASHAAALWSVTHPTTAEDTWINETVNAGDIKFTGFVGFLDDLGNNVKSFGSNIWKALNGLIKNLPLIIILALVAVIAFYGIPKLKKST